MKTYKVGDLVFTKFKNRFDLDCAGTVERVGDGAADVRVWNMYGPGADCLVLNIPTEELTLDEQNENQKHKRV